jgi:hypothetical protein
MNIRAVKAVELTLPKAPKMVDLVPDDAQAHGGATIADTNVADGFLVIMRAYLLQAENDLLKLYLNDDVVSSTTIAKGAENDDTPLRIPSGVFQKGYNRIKFGIKRTSQDEEFTSDLILLHRTSPPGDTPPMLNISVSHDSIGPDEADDVSVSITYKNTQWYDRIFIDCNGVRVEHRVLPESTSPLPPIPQNSVVPIPRTVLALAGDDSDFEFKFRVLDYVNNPSGPPTWSAGVTADVHLDRLKLPMAVLREIPNENNDDPTIVDLGKLNGGPLWAMVHLVESHWVIGDSIHLTFTAEVKGAVVAKHDQTLPITQVPTHLAWDIPHAKVAIDSVVKVLYQLIRNGVIVASSTPATAQVIGRDTSNLQPPKLLEPGVNPIDSLAYPQGVILQIEYSDAQIGDHARLIEIDAPANSPPFPLIEFDSNKRAKNLLKPDFLAAHHGKEMKFKWSLYNDDKPLGESAALELAVLKIADNDPRFPTPEIKEAIGSVGVKLLDLQTFPRDVTVFVAPWPMIAAGQRIRLQVDVVLENGQSDVVILEPGRKIDHTESIKGIFATLPRKTLHTLNSGSRIITTLKVSFDADEEYIILPALLTFLLRPITTEKFDRHPLFSLQEGMGVKISKMTMHNINGTGKCGVRNQDQLPGMLDGPAVFVSSGKSSPAHTEIDTVDFALDAPCVEIRFSCVMQSHAVLITFYNPEGDTIGQIQLPASSSYGTPHNKWIEFSAPQGESISRFQTKTSDFLYFDYFTFTF